jgi:hypothetical protein
MMNLEKYTERARGFVQSAQWLALREGHQQFTPEHVLKVLLDDEEGLAAGLIDRAGGNSRQALTEVEAALAKLPKVEGSGAGQLYMAPPPACRFCSQASRLLRPSLTSPVRSSSAMAPHLPDAIRRRKRPGWARDLPVPGQRASAHARVSDRAELSEHSRCRVPPRRLPWGLKRRRPG